MDAGRELDALVAEKVMGWTERDLAFEQCGPPQLYYYPDKDNERGLPAYSTDIAAAWEVVERLGARTLILEQTSREPNGALAYAVYSDGWDMIEDQALARSSSAPHAICLAALKAIGVEVSMS